MANNDCEAEAIALILRRSHDETAAITSDATIAGQANLKMPLALALRLLMPRRLRKGSAAWKAWCQAAHVPSEVEVRTRRTALRRANTRADRDAQVKMLRHGVSIVRRGRDEDEGPGPETHCEDLMATAEALLALAARSTAPAGTGRRS